jgi:LacI family transcriptional regulator
VLASNDSLARELTQHCQLGRISVPEDLAILGVGDDEFVCGMSNPPLSSVCLGMSRVGREAARLLRRMMNGHRPRRLSILVSPLDVAVRQSSDTLAVQDPEVRAALRYINQRLGEPMTIPDIANSVALSRSMLGKKFRRVLRRSPLREVRRLRVSAAERLLAETTLPLKEIARRCGFGSAVRFSMPFRQETGVSPSRYRQRQACP